MGKNIYFEALITVTKENFFQQIVVEFVNWL